MGISFPNEARSFDSKTNCVRFSGYDGMFEVKFYLATEVLACEESRRNASKSDYLSSFNALRLRILKAAASAYLKEKGSAISLDLGNFVEQTALLKGYDRA